MSRPDLARQVSPRRVTSKPPSDAAAAAAAQGSQAYGSGPAAVEGREPQGHSSAGRRPARARAARRRGPMAAFDWNARSCGMHGHATYAPLEPALAARLSTETPVGQAWRCLRCGSYVPGPARGEGPADAAPIVLRGRALRDAYVLRLLAVERGLRGLLLVALAYGLWKFNGARESLQQVFESYIPALQPLATRLGVDLNETGPVHTIERLFRLDKATLVLVALGVLAYGLLEMTESVGLWLMRRWGEYVAVVGTSLFIPLEVYELWEKLTWVRVGALLLNLFAVGYLLWTKRLFGLRGGRPAFDLQRRGESLLELEQAAVRRADTESGADSEAQEDSEAETGAGAGAGAGAGEESSAQVIAATTSSAAL